MFIDSAYAADSDPVNTSFDLWSLAPMVLVIGVFYFLIIRPQQKKAKRHRAMLNAIKVGDKITTGGGIIGMVSGVSDGVLRVNLNKDNVVEVARDMVSYVHQPEVHMPKAKPSSKSSVKPKPVAMPKLVAKKAKAVKKRAKKK